MLSIFLAPVAWLAISPSRTGAMVVTLAAAALFAVVAWAGIAEDHARGIYGEETVHVSDMIILLAIYAALAFGIVEARIRLRSISQSASGS